MIEIIIWLIFFPLATNLDNYLTDKNNLQRGENVTDKSTKKVKSFIEIIVFVVVLSFLIKHK